MLLNLVFRSAADRRFLFALVAFIFACHHAYSDDTPAVAAWKAALVEQLRNHAGYPKLLEKLKIDGVVLLTFAVNWKGQVSGVRISRGSGSALLDQHTLEIPYAAEPLPKPPNDLIGDHFTFTVPIRYGVDQERN